MNNFKEFLYNEIKEIKNNRNEKINRVIEILLLVGVLLIHISSIGNKIWAYIVLFILLSIIEVILKRKDRK